MADDQSLLDLATALADGARIDWESATRSITDDTNRALLAELQLIAAVTHVCDTSSEPTENPGAAAADWGPLRIIEQLGRGTFGDVYRAWDSRLDREVALKVLRRREHPDEARDSTVIHEGRLLARVRHPNVVTVYGAERIDGRVGMWMEYIVGETLEKELREHGPLDVDHVVKIGTDLSRALSAVHRAGLIHRDVKAQNVMRDQDGRLVLTDFGAGCELEETPDGAARELAGTPMYAAPEVLAGQPATPQSDVYSLGVLLYYSLTGTYPVQGRSLKEVREAHAGGSRVPLREARVDLPRCLVQIVDRAIDPDPRQRYEKADMLGDELSTLVQPKNGAGARMHAAGRRGIYTAMAVLLVVTVAFAVSQNSETPANPVQDTVGRASETPADPVQRIVSRASETQASPLQGAANGAAVPAQGSGPQIGQGVGNSAQAPRSWTITVIEFPGATRTYPLRINDNGVIAGAYTLTQAAEPTRGFLLNNGVFTTIDVPDAVRTRPTGLNNVGDVVGEFTDANGAVHGFLLRAKVFTVIDVPGARYTRANAINGSGDIAGDYRDATGRPHGYLFSRGLYTNIDVPGTASTRAIGLNDEGAVVGDYQDAAGTHGFLFVNNRFTTINAPGGDQTQAFGVNAQGTVVGAYGSPSRHAFSFRQGEFTPIEVPGSTRTDATAINVSGVIVGSFLGGAPTKIRGFLLTP